MIEKTKVLSPTLFLISPSQNIFISKDMTLGRSSGDILINDEKMSALHCQFIFRGVEMFVIDLGSTNGVFVNSHKIFPNKEFKVLYGDKVMIGNVEYVISQTSKLPDLPQAVPAKKQIFNLSDKWKSVYAIGVLVVFCSFIFHLQLSYPIPKDISFIGSLYAKLIFSEGIKEIFYILIVTVLHALIISHLLKDYMSQLLMGIIYVAFIATSFDYRYGPVWYVKQYLDKREFVATKYPGKTAVLYFRELISAESKMIEAFSHIEPKLVENEKSLLATDLAKMQILIKDREKNVIDVEKK